MIGNEQSRETTDNSKNNQNAGYKQQLRSAFLGWTVAANGHTPNPGFVFTAARLAILQFAIVSFPTSLGSPKSEPRIRAPECYSSAATTHLAAHITTALVSRNPV